MREPPAPPESMEALASVRGVVFDIQRYSLHDGPGLRTNVFLKGCPLRCEWCANPESQSTRPEPMLRAAQCIQCGHFAEPCPECFAGWLAQRNAPEVQAAIDERAAICPTGALGWAGAWRTAGDVLAEVLRDRPFYGAGGSKAAMGGMTLTGGEPTMQPAFCAALLQLARGAGIATAMESCGLGPWEVFEALLPWIDVLLYDVKHVDPALHRKHTGADNVRILDNLQRASRAGATIRIRVPLVPGFNADPASIAAIAALAQGLPKPVQGVDLLPYHTMARSKYAALGRDYPWPDVPRLSEQEISSFARIVAAFGLAATVGG